VVDLQKVKQGGVFKYVQVGGQYRFVAVTGFGGGHASLVNKGEMAESAGMIAVRQDGWKMLDTGSTSLHIPSDRMKDDETFTKMFGKQIEEY